MLLCEIKKKKIEGPAMTSTLDATLKFDIS